MPTPSSGPISFQDLQTAFGTGVPVSFNTLYRGGSNVPDITPNDAISTANTISLQEFYSTWGNKTLSFTITVGSAAVSGKGYYFGYGHLTKGSNFGSIDQSTFLTPNGPMTIEGLYYGTSTTSWHLHLSSASAPANTDLTFKSVSISGYSIGGIRNSATSTQTVGTARRWNWHRKSTAHPTSGTITCTLNYYG
jgi:hypothetical protein